MVINFRNIKYYFKEAIKVAQKSSQEVPVGCLLLSEKGEILLRKHNNMQSKINICNFS